MEQRRRQIEPFRMIVCVGVEPTGLLSYHYVAEVEGLKFLTLNHRDETDIAENFTGFCVTSLVNKNVAQHSNFLYPRYPQLKDKISKVV